MDEDGEAEYGAPPRLGFRARGRWWPRGRRRKAATALGRRWGTRRRTRRDLGGEGKYLREEGGLTRTRSRGGGLVLIPGVAAAWGGEPVGRRPQARALGRPHSEDDAGGGAGRLGSARWAEAQGGARWPAGPISPVEGWGAFPFSFTVNSFSFLF